MCHILKSLIVVLLKKTITNNLKKQLAKDSCEMSKSTEKSLSFLHDIEQYHHCLHKKNIYRLFGRDSNNTR